MFLTWAFTAVLVAYFSLISFRILQPLAGYRRARGRIREVGGRITAHKGEETVTGGSEKIKSAFPVYSFQIEGEDKEITGEIRLPETAREIGAEITVLYDGETGSAWCKEDIPLMYAAAKKRIAFIIILVAVVTAVGFLP